MQILLVAPAIVYLVALTQAPFAVTLWYSLHKWILTEPELGRPFVGFSNFGEALLHDAIFRTSILNLVEITGSIVVASLGLGLLLALLLNRTFPGRGVVRALLITPFFVMPTVNAVVWKNLLLNPNYGLFSWATDSLGLGRLDIFASAPKLGIVVMAVWQWTPFMMLVLLAGLQSLPNEVHEAALIDGANAWSEFRHVTLPLLGPYIELALLLGSIYILQLFGEIFVATQGGPGSATTTLPYYVYQTISQDHDVGMASAQAVLAIVVASLIASLLLRLMGRMFRPVAS
ncbi:MAG TPA: sugar ABC transporter permease [Candidatus Baltobacteraceae bacterium]|jgi:sorbitol/mannitol transport system permease protein|nr:sugar ABC transporter permease [Candidatus Baltobacteraceae bacterium]